MAAGLVLILGVVVWAAPGAIERHFNQVDDSSASVPVASGSLHSSLRVVDLHADSLLWGRDLLERGSRGQVDVPRLLEGNVALQAFTVVTSTTGLTRGGDSVRWLALLQLWPPRSLTSLEARALHQARLFDGYVRRSGAKLVAVRTQADLRAALERKRAGDQLVGGFLGLEGAHALEADGALERLDAAGFRMVGLAHFFDNEFAGSAHGARRGGLTPRGRELVRQIEARRMLVDLAHSSPATIRDTLAVATRPVIVSHTGVRGTCDNERNLSDQQLRGIAANGGLVGIGYWHAAVCGDDVPAIVRALRHAVSQAGLEHVALGSDFDGAVRTPFDAAGLEKLTRGLQAAGFGEAEVRKLMGENALAFLARSLPEGP